MTAYMATRVAVTACLAMIMLFAGSIAAQDLTWRVYGQLTEGRHHFNAHYIGDGMILVFGGQVGAGSILGGSATKNCEIIDLKTDEVYPTLPMNEVHSVCPFMVDRDGAPIVIGGGTDVVERFDLRSRTWRRLGTLQRSRWQHAAAWLSHNEILVVGGFGDQSAEVFNVSTGQSRSLPDFPYAANSMRGVSRTGESPLFFGFREGGPGSTRSDRAYAYSESAGWYTTVQFPDAAVRPEVLTLRNGAVVAVSGAVSEEPFRTSRAVSALPISGNDTISVIGSLSFGRQHHAIAEFQTGRVLVAGGFGDDAVYLGSTEFVDVARRVVTYGPDLITARSSFQLVSARYNGRLVAVAISGLTTDGTTNTIEILELCSGNNEGAPIGELSYNGDARREGADISLTRLRRFSAGSIWKPYVGSPTRDGFHHRIKARFANGDNNNEPERTSPGADGLVLVIQRGGVDALGEPGRGIGYSGIKHAVAVEFDTYVNHSNGDPSDHHLAVMKPVADTLTAIHSTASTVASTINIPVIVSDSTPFYIDYHYLDKKLTVTVTKDSSFDRHSLVVENLDIDSLIRLAPGQPYFIGFTSATGIAVQNHIIDEWTEFSCLEPLNTTSVHEPTPGYPASIPHNHTLVVQPSPASSSATVHLPVDKGAPTSLVVYDMQGRDVLRLNLVDGASTVNLAVDHLAAGMYVVHVHTAANILTGLLPVSR